MFAAQAIYNQLKRYSGDVAVTIDGMCASAATIIACAGGKVTMPANAVYMIHNPVSAYIGYISADDAEAIAKQLDTVKDTIIAVYHDRVNGTLSDSKLSKLMDNETWMSAKEAQENGFVDEIDEQAAIEDRLEGNMLVMNSVSIPLDKFRNTAKLRGILAKNVQKSAESEEKTVKDDDLLTKIKAVLGLENSAPKEAEPSAEDAVKAERERVTALDELKNGNPYVDSIIETAKKNGQSADDVKPYIEAMPEPPKDDSKKALDAIRALIRDNMESGADEVKPAPAVNPQQEQKQEEKNDIDTIVNLVNAKR